MCVCVCVYVYVCLYVYMHVSVSACVYTGKRTKILLLCILIVLCVIVLSCCILFMQFWNDLVVCMLISSSTHGMCAFILCNNVQDTPCHAICTITGVCSGVLKWVLSGMLTQRLHLATSSEICAILIEICIYEANSSNRSPAGMRQTVLIEVLQLWGSLQQGSPCNMNSPYLPHKWLTCNIYTVPFT